MPKLWLLSFVTGMQHSNLSRDPCVGSIEALLPPLGVAMIVQAIIALAFLASVDWTGELHKKRFLDFQVIYFVSCGAYAYFHWPNMAGLWNGAIYSSLAACYMWSHLDCRMKAETARRATWRAQIRAMKARLAKRQDRGDACEQVYWTYNNNSSTSNEFVSSRRRFIAGYMLYSFIASTLGFVLAYLNESLHTALKFFGLVSLGIVIVAMLILEFARDESALSLADDFQTWNVLSAAVLVFLGLVGWCFYGGHVTCITVCMVSWTTAMHMGIVGVLEGTALRYDQDSDDENTDGNWSDLSDSWEVL